MSAKRKALSCILSALLVFSLNPATAWAGGLRAAEGGIGDDGISDGGIAAVGDLADIAFVYLESSSLSLGQMQNIVVGFADSSLVVEDAQLELANSTTGEAIALPQSAAVEGAALFEVPADALGLGAFEVAGLRYPDGASRICQVLFGEDDTAAYRFEVVADEGGQCAESGIEVYAVDADGELVSADSIDEVLAKAGVVATGGTARTNGARGLSVQAHDDIVVVLDAGHGGHDSGATGFGLLEKDLNLRIAQYCRERLEQYEGVTVYMTRDDDTYVSLDDRVEFSKRVGATVVVSIHNNSSSSGEGHGSEVIVPRAGTWYFEETHIRGTELAREILDRITALGLTYRSIYSRDCTTDDRYPDGTLEDYFTLICGPRAVGICGIIVEHAFVSNESDAAFLASDDNLRKLGYADAEGIAAQFNLDGLSEDFYWSVYDYDYYLEHNPDEKAAYADDREGAFLRFRNEGRAEGQRASVLFDPVYYRETYPDLEAVYGDDWVRYYKHFMRYGMDEGRRGSADFDPVYYRAIYTDLDAAFGDDQELYYHHYWEYGLAEGRRAVRGDDAGIPIPGASNLVGVTTVFNDVDYSAVFDPVYYLQQNPDVVYHATRSDFVSGSILVHHFVQYGMAEGRASKESFSLASYFNAYADLRRAFEADWAAYYRHYVEYGQREGRGTSGVGSLVNMRTEAEGLDWSPVYDPAYYLERNPDVEAAGIRTFSSGSVLDDNFVVNHLMEYGMREQRTTSPSFDFIGYRARYADLRAAFGVDWKAYYRHYVEFGQREGRNASAATDEELQAERIMGQTRTSVDQMVRRYQSVGRPYPAEVYARYGAGDIRAFCQILFEEAQVEGVRAEVVFAQAMHETGWLQFGGDVRAEQCNFAGLGATGGVPGNSFNEYGGDSVRMGLRAQIQHLKAYASTDSLVNPLIDARFGYVTRGCAPSVYDLGGKWAVGASYGMSLMKQMDALLAA